MIGRILVSIVLIFLVVFIFSTCYNFIKSNILNRKRMRKLDQWSAFHNQLTEWAKEIVDSNLRVEFINECVSKLVLGESDRFDKDMLDDWDIDESKKNICDKWGKHIPSLLQEMRDNKLNQIL
jgi:hypothetical protein